MTGRAKQAGPQVVETDAAAAEVQSLLAELIGKHGLSVGAVLIGARQAIGRLQRRHPGAGRDLAAAPFAGRA